MTVKISELGAHEGGEVTLQGWVETMRSHGKVAFVVLHRDPGSDEEYQLSPTEIQGAGGFEQAYSNESFWVYRRVSKTEGVDS